MTRVAKAGQCVAGFVFGVPLTWGAFLAVLGIDSEVYDRLVPLRASISVIPMLLVLLPAALVLWLAPRLRPATIGLIAACLLTGSALFLLITW
ncbi:hypothetical protein ACFYTF_18315 [Nocardia thailandica]|uniref:Uncharacterized protein n=1 Tax=Nocardia thailandica TaxID=257275 RepID=A0ABW6PR17_9NOCA